MIQKVAGKALHKYRYIRAKMQYRYPGLFQSCEEFSGRALNEKTFAYGDPDSRRRLCAMYRAYFTKSLDEEIAFAEDICDHRFSLLGHPHQHGKEIQWNIDPASNKPWESGFSLDIVFRGPRRIGDIKLVWELNKHQYLFVLAKMYLVTGEARYRDEVASQINSWIEKNPPYNGINWISALEMGARVISWIMVYPFIKECLVVGTIDKYLRSLMLQMKFIEENLSYGKFPNTHLIGEASALIVGGLFLNAKDSKRWVSKGTDILSRHILNLSFADGVYKEQSLNYQRFFLDYFYLILILLKRNGTGFSDVIEKRIETMTEFLMYALMPDGTAPSFGDADDARGIYIKHPCIDDYRSTLALGATLFNRGDFKHVAGEMPQEILWLTGVEGVERYHQIQEAPPKETSKAYAEGGYYVMRGGWERKANYLIFDCGPLGHGPAGHGHADALSFQVSSGGFPFLVDPGTYSYNLDYAWRDYFRSTSAHNTISVDGQSQSEMKDRMSWGTAARARCNFWLSSHLFDLADGEHDGCKRLEDPVSHRRVIFYDRKDSWIIADRIQCSANHVFDCCFHMHPDCSVVVDNEQNRLMLCSPENKEITMQFIGDPDQESEIKMSCDAQDKRHGWFSANYGVKRATQTVRWRKSTTGDTWFITFINSAARGSRVNCTRGDGYLKFSLRNEEEKNEDLFFYSFEGPQTFENHDLKFRGKCLFVRKRGRVVSDIFAKDFTLFETEGVALASERGIQSLALAGSNCQISISNEDVQKMKLSCSGGIRAVINDRKIESEYTGILQGGRV